MATSQAFIERRAAQRFDFHRSVSVRRGAEEGLAFTQDLSARGMFLYTDMVLCVLDDLELVLNMPSEITLSEDVRVRCQVRVLRVLPAATSHKSGVAVLVKNYEFLKEAHPIPAPRPAQEPTLEEEVALQHKSTAWTTSGAR